MHTLIKALIAGAAGTSALNLVTYADMVIRGRPASGTPKQAVEKMADLAGVELESENRKEALGALLGYATGAGAAVCHVFLAGRVSWPVGVAALTGLAMTGSNAPLAALGVTDPREWPASSWVSDAVPHLAYGVTTYAAYEFLRS